MLSPVPYDIKWTAKLVKRDVKNILKRIRNRFTTKPAPAEQSLGQELRSSYFLPTTPASYDTVDRHAEPSIQSSANSLPSMISTLDGEFDTVQHYMEHLLDMSYKHRVRYQPHEERWKVRGTRLILGMMLNSLPPYFNNVAFLDLISDHSLSVEAERLLFSLSPKPTRTSKTPADPYSSQQRIHTRDIDSGYASATQEQMPEFESDVLDQSLSPEHVWSGIMIGLRDVTKTEQLAETILRIALDKQDCERFIIEAGDPSVMLLHGMWENGWRRSSRFCCYECEALIEHADRIPSPLLALHSC